jgi:pyruvate kinase
MKKGLKDNILNLNNSYILTAGDPIGVSGSTNTIRLLRKKEMEFFQNLKINTNTN